MCLLILILFSKFALGWMTLHLSKSSGTQGTKICVKENYCFKRQLLAYNNGQTVNLTAGGVPKLHTFSDYDCNDYTSTADIGEFQYDNAGGPKLVDSTGCYLDCWVTETLFDGSDCFEGNEVLKRCVDINFPGCHNNRKYERGGCVCQAEDCACASEVCNCPEASCGGSRRNGVLF